MVSHGLLRISSSWMDNAKTHESDFAAALMAALKSAASWLGLV